MLLMPYNNKVLAMGTASSVKSKLDAAYPCPAVDIRVLMDPGHPLHGVLL